MNDFFVSVSEHLPRLYRNNEAFYLDGQLPDEYVIDLTTTLQALRKVKTNKATGPDNVPAWIPKNHANILAGPLKNQLGQIKNAYQFYARPRVQKYGAKINN